MTFQVCAGLDLSLRSAGVAIITAPFEAKYFTFGYALKKGATNRDHLERVINITNNVMFVLKKHKCDHIGIENYGFASKGKISMQADLGGTIKSQIYVGGSLPILIASLTVRKYLLGKGVASSSKSKVLVRDCLVEKGYPMPGNLDESDALGVAHIVYEWANRCADSSAYNQKLFGEIERHRTKTI